MSISTQSTSQFEFDLKTDVQLYNETLQDSGEKITSGSVDLVLMDPPYGHFSDNTPNIDGWDEKNVDEWDHEIEPTELFFVIENILRNKGKAVIFSAEPYTSRLIHHNPENMEFSYKCIWLKNKYGNPLMSNTAPLKYTEDILVFCKTHDSELSHPLRTYFAGLYEWLSVESKSEIHDILGHTKADHTFRFDSSQFSIPTQETYNELNHVFSIQDFPDFLDFQTIKKIDREYKESHTSVFNLAEHENHKSNVFEYSKPSDEKGYHPTQKPVPLLRDLIRTYSREGDTVADLTMGSGSTGVAAVRESRMFLGAEPDSEFFAIAKNRINSALDFSK